MQRNADAANEIKPAADRNPRDGALQERLGELYVLSHTRDPARRVCEAWLRSDPYAARAYWLRGRIALGDLQVLPAIDDFGDALSAWRRLIRRSFTLSGRRSPAPPRAAI